MAARRKCPHCGYENLPQAAVCFQCGRALEEESEAGAAAAPGATRRSQRIVQAMWHPESTDGPPESPPKSTGMLQELKLEEPVTCLRCGTLNPPAEEHCIGCGASLQVDLHTHIRVRASARTDVGMVRENNEDSVGLWALEGIVLALVADGMGGAAAGEEASRLTVEAIQADFLGKTSSMSLLDLAEEFIGEKLMAAIQTANLAVIDRVDQDATLRGMGTTATLALVRGRRAFIAHVGDSRAYLIDGEARRIHQITSDHSFVEALLTAGHITETQALDHPMKNVLYRALGQTPDTTADLYNRYLHAGDRIVLCSDGLTRHLSPNDIAELVLQDNNPEAATQCLIDEANARGGEDNISVIVILLEQAPIPPDQRTVEVAYPQEEDDPPPPPPVPARPSDSKVTLIPTEPSDDEDTLAEGRATRQDLLEELDPDESDMLTTRRTATISDTQEMPVVTEADIATDWDSGVLQRPPGFVEPPFPRRPDDLPEMPGGGSAPDQNARAHPPGEGAPPRAPAE